MQELSTRTFFISVNICPSVYICPLVVYLSLSLYIVHQGCICPSAYILSISGVPIPNIGSLMSDTWVLEEPLFITENVQLSCSFWSCSLQPVLVAVVGVRDTICHTTSCQAQEKLRGDYDKPGLQIDGVGHTGRPTKALMLHSSCVQWGHYMVARRCLWLRWRAHPLHYTHLQENTQSCKEHCGIMRSSTATAGTWMAELEHAWLDQGLLLPFYKVLDYPFMSQHMHLVGWIGVLCHSTCTVVTLLIWPLLSSGNSGRIIIKWGDLSSGGCLDGLMVWIHQSSYNQLLQPQEHCLDIV